MTEVRESLYCRPHGNGKNTAPRESRTTTSTTQHQPNITLA
jgi:hypothetical protein